MEVYIMAEKIIIFGKNAWPYTKAAREAFARKGRDIEYFDVLSDKEKLNEMLEYSDGARKVPIIVDQDKVSIGFNGRAWGV